MFQQERKGNLHTDLAPTLGGSHGILLLPDDDTRDACHELATRILPSEAEFIADHSHITLYHGYLKEAPTERILNSVDRLEHLVGANFDLNSVELFGGKFVFYNLTFDDRIGDAHRQALGMAEFLDQDVVARSVSEGLELTPDQQSSLERYGHPLVGELYIPHITLGYHSALPQSDFESMPRTMSVKSVVLARIGEFGAADELLYEVDSL